jgi:hypothetical protein
MLPPRWTPTTIETSTLACAQDEDPDHKKQNKRIWNPTVERKPLRAKNYISLPTTKSPQFYLGNKDTIGLDRNNRCETKKFREWLNPEFDSQFAPKNLQFDNNRNQPINK